MEPRPLHDRLIVRRVDEEHRPLGGIVLPDTAAGKPTQGEVVAIGVDKDGPGIRQAA